MTRGEGYPRSCLTDRRITRSSFDLAHDSITSGSRPANGEFRDDTVSNSNNHHANHHRGRQSPFELNGRSCSSNLFFSTRDRDYIAFRAAILGRRCREAGNFSVVEPDRWSGINTRNYRVNLPRGAVRSFPLSLSVRWISSVDWNDT